MIIKDVNGNFVVIYKDGLIDIKFLLEFISLNK